MLKKIMIIVFALLLIPAIIHADGDKPYQEDLGNKGPNAGFEGVNAKTMKHLKIGEGMSIAHTEDTNEKELNTENKNENNEEEKEPNPNPGDLVYVKLDDNNSISFHYVPGGDFTMGSKEGGENEKDHEIEIPKGFWMGKFEITQPQWQAVMNDNPSKNKNVQQPVTDISFKDIEKFLEKMDELNFSVRLPTEAEWEYSCRAGTDTKYYFGDKIDDKFCVYNDPKHGNFNPEMRDAGSKEANDFGLHDMSGNASEWVNDVYKADYYKESPELDPQGPEKNDSNKNTERSVRGGSYLNNAGSLASYRRDKRSESFKGPNVGFRVIWTPEEKKNEKEQE